MKLTLLQWHPYTNRQLDIKTTLTAYKNGRSEGSAWQSFNKQNFVKGDGIDTSATITYPIGQSDDYEYDYLIVSDDDTESTTSNNIISRWYITESNWNRKMQRILTLKRDVLAEIWDSIQADDMFVEKGCVTNNLIFNEENIQLNQIKQSQQFLYSSNNDDSKDGYVVIYVANNTPKLTLPNSPDISIYEKLDDWELFAAYQAAQSNLATTPITDLKIKYKLGTSNSTSSQSYYLITTTEYGTTTPTSSTGSSLCRRYYSGSPTNLGPALRTLTISQADMFPDIGKYTIVSDYSSWNNRYIYIKSTNSFYKVTTSVAEITEHPFLNSDSMAPAYSVFVTHASAITSRASTVGTAGEITNSTILEDVVGLRYGTYGLVSITLTAASPSGKITTFEEQKMDYSSNVPYNMLFCTATTAHKKTWAYLSKYFGEYLYDMQLVPYKPDITSYSSHEYTTVAGILMYYINNPEYNTTLTSNNPSFIPTQTTSWKKRTSQTDLIRLVSPDYSSAYEFSPRQMNWNAAQPSLKAKTSLKPFNTQIWIYPEFGGIYGPDGYIPSGGTYTKYQDNRGLIYNGSFSLPRVNSAWVDYQIQNASYSDAFNRQIQNQAVIHKYDMAESGVSALTNAVGTGVKIGAYTGNAGIGAAAGAASLIGGIADQYITQGKFNESIDYTKDMYGFNLRNIKARANTLTTSGAMSCLNHLFPQLEYYTCSAEEATAFDNKIKYDGMTVGAIMQVSAIVANVDASVTKFIKGYITKFNTLQEDAHFLDAVQQALMKGIYKE